MSKSEELEYQSFEEDVQFLVDTLAKCFESVDAEFYIDEHNETLYIKLEGLQEYSEAETEEIAGPVLEEIDMDFEQIVLLPL
jgi:hypothetical protein